MMGACFLTYDIISSGIKTSAFSQDGKLLAHAYRPLLIHFSGNTAQEPVESWLSGFEETTREVAGQTSLQNLGAIAFTAMSQVCLCIDRDGAPLHEAFTWSDSRSEEVGDPISRRLSQDQVYRLTGLKNTPNSSIRKLFWIKERWPEVYEKTYKMIQCKDYLAYVLTGAVYTDFTDASSTGALDITTMDWSEEILSCLGIDRDKLPAIAHSNQIIGHVTDQAASSFGLPAGVPVVMGAGDILCSAVGAGCIEHGDVYMSLGSSSWVASCMDKPNFSTGASLNPHAIPGKFLGFVNYQTAGVVFKWLKNEVFRYNPDGDRAVRPYQNIYPYEGMEEQARLSPPGTHGLLFLPYILEADPAHPEAWAKGAYLGLTWQHTREDMLRAALEGVCFELRRFTEGFTGGKKPKVVTVTGIASHEGLWLQILSDVLGVPVQNTVLHDTPDSIGAAILAGQATGVYPDFAQADRFRAIEQVFEPDPARAAQYEALYPIYLDAFGGIEATLKRLERLK